MAQMMTSARHASLRAPFPTRRARTLDVHLQRGSHRRAWALLRLRCASSAAPPGPERRCLATLQQVGVTRLRVSCASLSPDASVARRMLPCAAANAVSSGAAQPAAPDANGKWAGLRVSYQVHPARQSCYRAVADAPTPLRVCPARTASRPRCLRMTAALRRRSINSRTRLRCSSRIALLNPAAFRGLPSEF